MDAQQTGLRRLYPEMAAGGFSRYDHQVLFYSRVRALLRGDETVLEFGAGRGKFAETLADCPFKLDLVSLGGACKTLIGGDVDPVVATNPFIDQAVLWSPDGSLPFADSSFDMIISWAVLEHVEAAERCARELDRVLRPGGWLCAWTPNRWGIAGVGAQLVPNTWHAWVLRRVVGSDRKGVDVYPTCYRMNTMSRLRRLFPPDRFVDASYALSGPPVYVARSRVATALARAYQAIPGHHTETFLHIFKQKRPSAPSAAPSVRALRRRTVAMRP